MKKLFSILALTLLVLAMSACTDSGSEETRTFSAQMLNNSVNVTDGTSDKVSSSILSMKMDVTNSTLSIDYSVPVTGNTVANVVVNDAQLVPDNELNCYTFTSANAGTGITNFKGYYSPQGCLHIEFDAFGTHHVSSNADLYFPYSSITMTKTEDENATPVESNKAEVNISIDPSNMKAVLAMGNFALENISGDIQSVYFRNLNAIATGDGFKVTTTEPVESTDGDYTITDLEAFVTGNGRVINATFTIKTKNNADVKVYNGILHGTQFAQ